MHPTNREFYQSFGLVVRRRRRALELSQETLAGRLSISRGALANIETGRQNILLHQLFRFAAALEMDVNDLLPTQSTGAEASRSKALPLPKGLTPEQAAQVARVFEVGEKKREQPQTRGLK